MIRINSDWEFVFQWSDGFGRGKGAGEAVRLPHTARELPLHCAGSADYETVSGYRRRLTVPGEAEGQRVLLQFDGAAHIATVYWNGRELATHRCGYTAFRVELTDYVRYGEENLLAVKLDSTENPAIPPFGFLIDYLTYGGLYRDVWLDIRPQKLVSELFVHIPDLTHAHISCEAALGDNDRLRFEIYAPDGGLAAAETAAPGQTELTLAVPDARAWSLEAPALYRCRVTLTENGRDGDVAETDFGFRTAVRTSHYPQSRYFIDECDRRGLLVFTEIPGWQHIGDEAWKEQAVQNVREMVTQYRNHPSVILWGVRINESQDDDALYVLTNAAAHELDPSRATSGVRYILQSHLLGEVYAFTNAEEVALYKNGEYTASFRPRGWKSLKHGSILIDNQYVDGWGDTATVWRFDALQGGRTVASVTRGHSAKLHLSVTASHTALTKGGSGPGAGRARQSCALCPAAGEAVPQRRGGAGGPGCDYTGGRQRRRLCAYRRQGRLRCAQPFHSSDRNRHCGIFHRNEIISGSKPHCPFGRSGFDPVPGTEPTEKIKKGGNDEVSELHF